MRPKLLQFLGKVFRQDLFNYVSRVGAQSWAAHAPVLLLRLLLTLLAFLWPAFLGAGYGNLPKIGKPSLKQKGLWVGGGGCLDQNCELSWALPLVLTSIHQHYDIGSHFSYFPACLPGVGLWEG
jgi:hypothetical protein